jgi:hypothetical protein
MASMLVDFQKHEFLQFWAQGCRPAVVLAYTPLRHWKPDELKSGVSIMELYRYHIPGGSFSQSISSSVLRQVRANCYPLFVRTYFRRWSTQSTWPNSWLDINNKFETFVQHYWQTIKDGNISVVLFNNAPHMGSGVILYHLCKVLNIPTMMCSASPFANALFMNRNIEDVGVDDIPSSLEPLVFDIAEIPASPFYMKGAGRISALKISSQLGKQAARIAFKTMTLSFLWNKKSLVKNFHKFRERYRSYAMQYRYRSLYSEYDPQQRYIYFPLHLQPELTTDVYGGEYGDQLLAIEELARALPPGMLIYVKENPKQSLYMRDPSFFERLMAIPQVRYLPIDVPTFELTKNAVAVATISGTAGWEAMQMGKPVICFGYGWYRGLPGAYTWNEIKDNLSETLSTFRFDKDALRRAFQQRCRILWPGVIDPDYAVLVKDYDAAAHLAMAVKSMLAYLRHIGFDEHGNALQPEVQPVHELA